MKRYLGLTFILFFALQINLFAFVQEDSRAVYAAIEQLQNHQYGQNEEQLQIIDKAVVTAQTNETLRQELEKRFITILGKKPTVAAKKYICSQLSLIGSVKAIPALAQLLAQPELSHMALFALERINDPSVQKVLIETLPKVEGSAKTGIINLLGTLRVENAVPSLVKLVGHSNKEIASAAVYGLGMIGTPQAVKALNDNLSNASDELNPQVLNAQLRIAENFLNENKNKDALKIYTRLFKNKKLEHARLAGFSGLINCQPKKADKILLDALAGDDEAICGFAAQHIAEMPVEKDLTFFLKSLPKLPTKGQVALIQSMALRKEQAAREYVLKLLKSKDKDVRTEVLNALGDIGNADDAMMLVTTAANTEDEGSEIARYSLARLEDKMVNKVLADGLEKAKPNVRVEIISSLGYRSATETTGNILPYLSDPDEEVRMASLLAMERLGNENHITPIINFIKQTKNDKEKQAADKVLHSIVATVGEKSTTPIQTAYSNADNTLRLQLLGLLHLVGGDDALELVRAAIKAENTEMKDVAIRTLANWTNENAMTDLREITQNTELQQNHRVLAFRGYIRLIRSQENPRRPKSSTLRRAMSMTERVEEKKLVLAAFGDLSDMSALKCVERYMYDEEIAEEACAAVISIARKVGQQNKTDTGLAMIQVLNRTKSPRVKRDANRILTSLGIDQQKLLGTGPTGTPTKKLVFLSGPMDHAPFPGAHDYIRDLVLLKRQLETASNIEPLDIKLYIGTKPDIAELKDAALLVVHSSADRMLGEVHALFPSFHEEYTEEYQTYLKEVDNLVKQGMGVMILHYSLWTDKPQSRKYMMDWVGGYHDDETADVKLDDFDVTFPTPSHSVMNGVKPWSGKEEYYFQQHLLKNDKRLVPLVAVTLKPENPNDPIGWALQRNKGRGFGFSGCHGHWMLLNLDYNRFVLNSIVWTAGIKVPQEGVVSKIPDDWDLVQQPN